MNRIRLYDGSFTNEMSATLAGDNSGQPPSRFKWCRNHCDSLFTWYTDTNLRKAEQDFYPARIAWLLEPPSISDNHYKVAYELRKQFRAIFTHIRFYVEFGHPFKFYPLGGSWIADKDWGVWGKGKDVSIIASEKKISEGHKLRHRIIAKYPKIPAYGSGYQRVKSKTSALGDYRYSIVVESYQGDYYFSEKLIDCLSVGTVPIYWGCPSINMYFDMDGIIAFDSIKQLEKILYRIGPEDYMRRLGAINRNLGKAQKYRCAEDWIWRHYKEYFK